MDQKKAGKRVFDFMLVGTILVIIPIVTIVMSFDVVLEIWPLYIAFAIIGVTLLIAALRLKAKYKILHGIKKSLTCKMFPLFYNQMN